MTPRLLKERIAACSYIDIHTHCDGYSQARGRELIKTLQTNRILCFSAGTDPLSWKKNNELAGLSEWVIPCVGIHPWKSGEIPVQTLSQWEEDFAGAVMINEIGLDTLWAPEEASPEKQTALFRGQLSLAERFGKPVTVHTKGAERKILTLLTPHKGTVLIHWYDGPLDLIPSFLDLGCYFTIPPALLKEKEKSGDYRKILKQIPEERLLPETDNPSAWPWLFNRPGKADQIREIYEYYAALIGKSEAFIHNRFQENLIRFLRL